MRGIWTSAATIARFAVAGSLMTLMAGGQSAPKAKVGVVDSTAIDYCGPLYELLTDASGMMMVTPPAAAGRGPARPYPFIQPLVQNIIHNNEEYGNIVGYFCAANLVPPSTAAANAAAGRGRGN